MEIQFYKYQGTGNDFVMIDNRNEVFPKDDRDFLVEKMCDRKFGIGADGLILVENHDEFDFRMIYFNADGKLASFCGNGGRCTAHYSHFLGMVGMKMTFLAFDGPHEAIIKDNNWVSLGMNDVTQIERINDQTFVLDTGSPHYVSFVPDIHKVNVVKEGRSVRYSKLYAESGINVNFVERFADGKIKVHTYERGVENETLACGTGVTAAAISLLEIDSSSMDQVDVITKGGALSVSLSKNEGGYGNIWLNGPVAQSFKGVYTI